MWMDFSMLKIVGYSDVVDIIRRSNSLIGISQIVHMSMFYIANTSYFDVVGSKKDVAGQISRDTGIAVKTGQNYITLAIKVGKRYKKLGDYETILSELTEDLLQAGYPPSTRGLESFLLDKNLLQSKSKPYNAGLGQILALIAAMQVSYNMGVKQRS